MEHHIIVAALTDAFESKPLHGEHLFEPTTRCYCRQLAVVKTRAVSRRKGDDRQAGLLFAKYS